MQVLQWIVEESYLHMCSNAIYVLMLFHGPNPNSHCLCGILVDKSTFSHICNMHHLHQFCHFHRICRIFLPSTSFLHRILIFSRNFVCSFLIEWCRSRDLDLPSTVPKTCSLSFSSYGDSEPWFLPLRVWVFSRGHATLHLAVLDGWLVGWSVHPSVRHIFEFQATFGLLLLPNCPQLDFRVSSLV